MSTTRANAEAARPDGSADAHRVRDPRPESQKLAGLIAFDNEKVDISVDGVWHERPTPKFS